jgi:hypothetical protein
MVDDVQHFSILIPAGTAIASPATTNLGMPPRKVRAVRFRIPPGPQGTVGFNLAMAGTSILPSNRNAWYVGDDEAFDWPLDNQPDSGAWQFRAYNTDTFDHTIELTFLMDLVQDQAAAGFLAPLDI